VGGGCLVYQVHRSGGCVLGLSLLNQLVTCSSFVNFKSPGTKPSAYGTNVADVMLVCEPAFPTVGCATLKSMSKLSYIIMEGGKCLFLCAALLVSEFIMFRVV